MNIFYPLPMDMTAFVIITGYLAGSVPFGLLIAKLVGAGDIRTQGSGNIGATNVLRTAGKLPGAIALILDIVKGAAPVLLALHWFAPETPQVAATAVAAFLGHLFPVFLRLRGGKGVATGLGVFLAWHPPLGLAMIAAWLITALSLRFSSLAALVAFALLPPLAGVWYGGYTLVAATVVAPLVFWRHRGNLQRLIQGVEPRIGKKG